MMNTITNFKPQGVNLQTQSGQVKESEPEINFDNLDNYLGEALGDMDSGNVATQKEIEKLQQLCKKTADELLAYDETDKDKRKGLTGNVALGDNMGFPGSMMSLPPITYVETDSKGNIQELSSGKLEVDREKQTVTIDMVSFEKDFMTEHIRVTSDFINKTETMVTERLTSDMMNPDKMSYNEHTKNAPLEGTFESLVNNYETVDGFISKEIS